MEKGKAKACRALGAQVCQLDGNYDQANRACRELSLASGIQFANITLRPFYAEGAKTMAFEVVEELGWSSPDHFVIPAAGGTLSSRVHKGLNELETVGLAETAATKINIAQAERLLADRDGDPSSGGEIEPQTPETAAHSLAIGAPGDGALVVDAVRTPRRLGRRRPPTRRSSRRSTCSARPRASSPSRPAAPRSPRRRSSPRGQDRPRRRPSSR